MRHNGRAPILASTTNPTRITLDLDAGWPATILCTDCDTWRLIKRGMITPHRATQDHSRPARLVRDRRTNTVTEATATRAPRCPGSAQRVTIDLTEGAWLAARAAHLYRLAAADQDPAGRTATTVTRIGDETTTPRDRRQVARQHHRQWMRAYAPNGPVTRTNRERLAPLAAATPHLRGADTSIATS